MMPVFELIFITYLIKLKRIRKIGTFKNTALVLEITLFTFGYFERMNSATRCNPCEKQVKCSIFGYTTCREAIAAII